MTTAPMRQPARCSGCSAAGGDLYVVLAGIRPNEGGQGRVLIHCSRCRGANDHDAAVPLALVTSDLFVGLYKLGLTASAPDFACELVFGRPIPDVVERAEKAIQQASARQKAARISTMPSEAQAGASAHTEDQHAGAPTESRAPLAAVIPFPQPTPDTAESLDLLKDAMDDLQKASDTLIEHAVGLAMNSPRSSLKSWSDAAPIGATFPVEEGDGVLETLGRCGDERVRIFAELWSRTLDALTELRLELSLANSND